MQVSGDLTTHDTHVTSLLCTHTILALYFGAFFVNPRSYYIHYKLLDEITYPSLNFNGATIEVWDCISNFISHFTGHVIIFVLTHCGLVDLRKWSILTPYWRHQSLGYLKKIWMPVVNIHWCPWTLKDFNIQLLMLIIKS